MKFNKSYFLFVIFFGFNLVHCQFNSTVEVPDHGVPNLILDSNDPLYSPPPEIIPVSEPTPPLRLCDSSGPSSIQLENRNDPLNLFIPDPFLDQLNPDTLGGYCSNTFGIWVDQLTDADPTGKSTYVMNSERTMFTSDDAYFFVARKYWVALFRANDGSLIHVFENKINETDMRLSKTNPRRFLWKNGSTLQWCDFSQYLVNPQTAQLTCTNILTIEELAWPKELEVKDLGWAGGDGNDISDNDKFLVLDTSTHFVILDLEFGEIDSLILKAPCTNIDYATMSSKGGYIINTCNTPRGIYIAPRGRNSWTLVAEWNNHTEVSLDENGDEVLFLSIESTQADVNWATENFDRYPGETEAFKAYDRLMLNLRTFQARVLMNLKPNPKYMYSGATFSVPSHKPNFLYVSTQKVTTDTLPASNLYNGWRVYEGEIIEIPTTSADRGKIRRLVHTYSSILGGSRSMEAQADIGVNNNATQIVFRATINSAFIDIYRFFIPPR